MLTSETYTSLSAAKTGIEAVRTASTSSTNFSSRYARTGEPYFVLRAANHEIIGTSELYSSDKERDKGIVACQRAAREAQVVDAR